jgi:phage terminase large subunit
MNLYKKLTEYIIELKRKYKIEKFYADPSQPALIKQMNSDGLHTLPAENEIMPGISAVCEKLKFDADGKPSLYIDKKCKNLIHELENYRYSKKTGENGSYTETPAKKDDHACDALRYAVYSIKKMFKPKSYKPKWL